MNNFDFFMSVRAYFATKREFDQLLQDGADIDTLERKKTALDCYQTLLESVITDVENLYHWPHDGMAQPNPKEPIIN